MFLGGRPVVIAYRADLYNYLHEEVFRGFGCLCLPGLWSKLWIWICEYVKADKAYNYTDRDLWFLEWWDSVDGLLFAENILWGLQAK